MKIIGQNHRFLGVNNAITSMLAIRGRTAGLRSAAFSQRIEWGNKSKLVPTSAMLRLAESALRGRLLAPGNQNRVVALSESGILPLLVKWRLHHCALACAAFSTVDRQS